jgi:hypothetical protein
MKIVEKFGTKYERVFADDLKLLILDLYKKVKNSKYQPDCIITLARGGFFPTRYYSDFSGITEVYTIRVEHYAGETKIAEKPKITQDLPPINLSKKRVILIEDVADSGKSLKEAVNHIKKYKPKELRVGVLYLKPWSIFKPDYYVRETDSWVLFDWEQREIAEGLLNKEEMKPLSPAQKRKELEDLGIQKEVIDLILEERGIMFG